MNLHIPRRVEHGLGPAPQSPKKTMKYGVMVRWLGGVGKIMLLVKVNQSGSVKQDSCDFCVIYGGEPSLFLGRSITNDSKFHKAKVGSS